MISLNASNAAPPVENALKMTKAMVTAEVHLSEVTFTYHITPTNQSADAGMQLYIKRADPAKGAVWEGVSANKADGSPLILSLYRGLDNTGTFVATLPKGSYSEYRLLLFNSPDGKSIDYGHMLYDSNNDPARAHQVVAMNIQSGEAPVHGPTLSYPPNALSSPNGDGTFTVTIPAIVKVPDGYTAPDMGLWAMAKGDPGFSQVWASLKQVQHSSDPENPYNFIPINFTLKSVKPGLWTEQFGLFTNQWGNPLYWSYPGMDFEVGGDSWEHKAPADRIPPRLRVRHGHFETADGTPYHFYDNAQGLVAVPFVRGGDYGNALDWTVNPTYNNPGYFTLLGDMGCHFIRVLFNPDRYLSQTSYQHAVDQVVQNIWAAGLYPLVAPQDLPQGDSTESRAAQGLKLMQMLADKYKGKSVWLEVCNEPHEYGSWATWKPVAEKCVKAIRAIDPDAFVIVPFENYSKDGRGAAKDPITDVAVDLYDGHAYVDPSQVATLFGQPAASGLPVLIGEYGGSADYLKKMDLAFQHEPKLMAVAPWALTVKGQDSLPLIADGSTAVLKFTPAGQVIADDYARWNAGKKVE
jgi:hypothetical protein